MSCEACDVECDGLRCRHCRWVKNLVADAEPGTYVLVVDGSVDAPPHGQKSTFPRPAGVGLVLAKAANEAVVAHAAIATEARTASEVEIFAIQIGLVWAPVERAWSDSLGGIVVVRRMGLQAEFMPDHMREPLHNLAHRLANAARLRDRERVGRIWIPRAVWR